MSGAPQLADARHVHSGKVRDLYELSDGRLLMVASDRVPAYDFVLSTPIPGKGAILTAMSLWWFDQLGDLVPNHVLSTDVADEVAGRAVVCERLAMYPVECVARGYLSGSATADYRRTGEVCGIALPPGLIGGSLLPEPIFTPATKALMGEHDQNIAYDAVVAVVGAEVAAELRRLTLAVYGRGRKLAEDRGVILADTKLEFGARSDGTVVLGDEVLTPDSSRFWDAEDWQPGRPQRSFDKQPVRDWLASPASGWNKDSGAPPPPLTADVVAHTRDRYAEAYRRLTGQPVPTADLSGV